MRLQLDDPWVRCATIVGWRFPLPFEIRLLIIVALAAALGSFVAVATSFSAFLGNGTYDPRWLWWYVLRTPIGISLAYVFYFAIRGGVLTTTSLSTSDINPFGLAALAGLVGLFSKQASDKLEETFKTLFKTGAGTGDDQREGKLQSVMPAIISIKPDTFAQGAPPATGLEVFGANFIKDKVSATIDGAAREIVRKDDRNLTVKLQAGDSNTAKTLKVTITNTTADSSGSASKDVTVT